MEESRKEIKRLAVLTSGGDSSGMNAAIRGAVRTAIFHGIETYGFYHGFQGLIDNEILPLRSMDVGGIITTGGTVLRTARSEEFRTQEGRQKAFEVLQQNGIDGLVVIGGDGSLTGAKLLHEEHGVQVVGVPASIDNDISCTDCSIGFDTAINAAMGAIDRVRDTAYSHDRVFVVEVMGRRNGMIALDVALAAGAEAVLLPEIPFSLPDICEDLLFTRKKGKKSSIIITAEGAAKAEDVQKYITASTAIETRYMVLGHMQRGGSPTAFDRVLALRLSSSGVERLLDGYGGEMVGIDGTRIVYTLLGYALDTPRTIDDRKIKLLEMMAV